MLLIYDYWTKSITWHKISIIYINKPSKIEKPLNYYSFKNDLFESQSLCFCSRWFQLYQVSLLYKFISMTRFNILFTIKLVLLNKGFIVPLVSTRSSPDTIHSNQSQFRKWRSLPYIWIMSLWFFSFLMFMTYYVRSQFEALVIIAACGIPWGITQVILIRDFTFLLGFSGFLSHWLQNSPLNHPMKK